MNRQARAFGISLLLHAGALLIVVTLSGAAAPAGSSRIIDLRILQSSGSAVDSLPKQSTTTPRLPPGKQNRPATAPPVKPRPRVAPPLEVPPLPAVPSPVAADPVASSVPPAPIASAVPVKALEPAAEPAAASEARMPEAAPSTSTSAAAVGDAVWSEARAGESPSGLAPVASASVVAPGEETGSTVSMERIVKQSSALQGGERGQSPRDFSSLREIVQRHLVYPSVARRRGWEGRVTLSFIVGGDGRVLEIAVLESSGRGLLDRHAVETVKKITCFPSAVAEARIIIPVVYRLN